MSGRVVPEENYGFAMWAVFSEGGDNFFLHKSETEASIHAELLGWEYAEVEAMEVVD